MALRPPPLRACSVPHLLDARPPGPSPPVRARDCHEGSGSRSSRCAARLPSPPVSGGSGGSRTSLQRMPPFPYLDADQRVQASSHQTHTQEENVDEEKEEKEKKKRIIKDEFEGKKLVSSINEDEKKKKAEELKEKFQLMCKICCVDESYVCFARENEDKWLIYDFETVKTEVTWEHLLACFKDYRSCVIFHKLDAGPPQTTKTKSLAELPVLLDEQFCKDSNIDPHLSTIVLNWLGSSESQDTLSDVLAGITSPVDTGFFCKSADSSTMYTVTSMICCVDESYVCFARDDEDKWLIYGFETVETEDTWEHLLERFKDCKLQPLSCNSHVKICCVDESYVCFARDDENKWLIYGFETVETEDTWEHLVELIKDCKLQPEVLFFEVIK